MRKCSARSGSWSNRDCSEVPTSAPARERTGNSLPWLAFFVAIIALAAAGYTAWHDWRSARDTSAGDALAEIDDRLGASARTLAELDARVTELGDQDPGVDAAVGALRRDFDERIRLLDSLPARMSTLT